MLFMAILYAAMAVVHRDLRWSRRAVVYRHPATWTVPALVGGLLAATYELWAVHVIGRWAYAEAMPTVFAVGLSPLLQMIVVPLLVVETCRHLLVAREPPEDA